ncbi:MAG TPA: Gfo/Idh/MocA family oxidoreductase [Gemmataceae bacterium]|jgi:predicted dehydrogenase|nr:Gfo/Idh/MocA family oxidoreductase [Gemmataceae bacterium]
MSETPASSVDRRGFLRSGAALSLSAVSYGNVVGANGRLGVAFVGCGGRAQAHINAVLKLKQDGQAIAPAGVCDVWDGQEDSYDHEFPPGQFTRRNYAQGLYPSAKKCKLNVNDSTRVTKDYRRLLDLKDVDVVCIATPDHWHARQTLDALAAGKDVFVEKPMTRSAAEGQAVVDAANKHNRVVVVGAQGLTDPSWRTANDLVKANRLGPVVQAQTGVHRNDVRGMWRYYRLTQKMSPKTIDWDLFLGHQFEVNGEPLGPKDLPFDRAAFAQWRCNSVFSGGVFTDLLAHKATQLLAATGLRYPRRVAGLGGLYWEHDGRDVPDVATLVADFDEGAQFVFTTTTVSAYPVEEVIRCRFGTIKFAKSLLQLMRDDPTRASGMPQRLEKSIEPTETVTITPPANETQALWEHFLGCVRDHNRATLCPPELGAAAVTMASMAVGSYSLGQVLTWDKEQRRVVSADGAWAERWNARSKARERFAGMQPPKYMDLAGPEHG